ncbi:UvrD-helicase domain-containing protein [Companilactobacillus mishanensis]|uniref:UvrD-helicase domain-containing protein n=1 Tax=Companilactobacillus mishanensis TaxID=2486008 RepID=UPI001296DAF2|nr:hypothetical protein [Companilactobacillus mishanensis]
MSKSILRRESTYSPNLVCFDSYADNLDTFAAMETMNKQIDYYNLKQEQMETTKNKITRLLPAPYFARIDLKYPDESQEIPFYIGSAGFSPTPEDPMILDWRSPIADLYYNNKMGQTSYLANDRDVEVSVDTRRQFLLHQNKLDDIFDSDVAIQDPLLVKTLQENKSNQMGSITATIQSEQNIIIRDTDSQALLVNGIAGSGKTSVVLQRIAYLLYRYRENLVADDVLLLTPNSLFTTYINRVLPSLGEESPRQMTFQQLLDQFVDTKTEFEGNQSHVELLSEELPKLELDTNNFRNIKLNGKLLFGKTTIKKHFDQTPKTLTLEKRLTALTSTLISILENTIQRDSLSDEKQAELSELTESQQEKIFGKTITPSSDKQVQQATKLMLQWQFRKVSKVLSNMSWLNLPTIVDNLTKTNTKNKLDYVYANLYLKNLTNKSLRFVMIDEIQDYSLDQIKFLITAYPKASWTLVGDEFQSIQDSKTPLTFDQLKTVFEAHSIKVKQRDLVTSYRSSGPITKTFVSYGSPELINRVKIIQTNGENPQLFQSSDEDELFENIKSQIEQFSLNKLSAIITSETKESQNIVEYLDNPNITVASDRSNLPEK